MITPTAGLRPLTGALLALALIVFGAPLSKSQVVLAQNQLFLSVFDRVTGEPVTDLKPDEVVVQWDDEDCETLDLAPISLPVRVTVFIDNRGGRFLWTVREGTRDFLDALPADVEVALLAISGRPRWMTRHTTDRDELARGLDLIPDGTGTPSRYLDAWAEAASRLNDDKARQYLPVIVIVAKDGPEASRITQGRFDQMKQRMVDNLATWHTLMFTYVGRPNPRGIVVRMAIEMGEVTRGTFQVVGFNSFGTQLLRLGRDIARKHTRARHQYQVTYVPPDGASDRPTISAKVTRPGINLVLTMTPDGNVP